jgi:hypothetical protein
MEVIRSSEASVYAPSTQRRIPEDDIVSVLTCLRSQKKKVKLSRHEDASGSGGVAPPFLTLALDEGEWSTPVALRPGKEPLVLIREEAGRAQVPVWALWE